MKQLWLVVVCLVLTGNLLNSCKREQVIDAHAEFTHEIVDENFTVPVRIKMINSSIGGNRFKWTFEGGTPASSEKQDPGIIVFNEAGSYNIKLETWNEDSRDEKSILVELDSSVTVDFDANILVNDFAPAQVAITNNTKGASSFNWTFSGGSPASSTQQDPGPIIFAGPGDHEITLTVSNGRKSFTLSKTITLQQPLQPAFAIKPGFEDEDDEAPLTATLNNTSISGLTWKWTSTGGVISNDTARSPEIHFTTPGAYTITLTADNKKEQKTVSNSITVLPDNNLRSFSNISLGISLAHSSTGSFFSTKLRKKFTAADDLSETGKDIDIIFYGLSKSFNYNRFISPDSAGHYSFNPIPGANPVTIINSLEYSPYAGSINPGLFDEMNNDQLLRSISIETSASSWKQFDNSTVPRILLFEKSNGIKGAIRVKQFVQDEQRSYIVVDIKVQKEPR